MTVGRSGGRPTGIGVVDAGLEAVYEALGVGGEDTEPEADDSEPDETDVDDTDEVESHGPAEGLTFPDAETGHDGTDDDADSIDFSFSGDVMSPTVRVANDSFGLDDVRRDDPYEYYETAHDEFKAVAEDVEFEGSIDDLELDELMLGDAMGVALDDSMENVDFDDLTADGPVEFVADHPAAADDVDAVWDPGIDRELAEILGLPPVFDGDGPDMDGFTFGRADAGIVPDGQDPATFDDGFDWST
ncbi:hypothetical protein [Haloarchaeobius sp. HRN-SO-5]|uniref:hypothetical protein n=1 Tax=Haloarchaeobius sp. HRN-SO-5 TaxID=3446118 RepID=UPI003EBFA89A